MSSIIIEGSDYFESKTFEALYVIQLKSLEKYHIVLKYIDKIEQQKQGKLMGMYSWTKTYVASKDTYCSQREWYAGSIVHESYHSKLYNDYFEKYGSIVPHHIYGGEEAEYACLEYQISFLEEIYADKYLINSAKKYRTQKWWASSYIVGRIDKSKQ